MDLSSFIESFSYIGIFLLMTANGLTNLPSSQLLYVVCGYFVSTGNLLFIPTVIAGALGNTVGNMAMFILVKKYGARFAQKLLMTDEKTFTKIYSALSVTFSKKGIWYIFVGKLIPSIKAFIPTLAGLARTPTLLTSIIFLVSSTLWAIGVTAVGYYFGTNVSASSFALISLVIGGTVLYLVYRSVSKNSIAVEK